MMRKSALKVGCIAATIETESPHPEALVGRGLGVESVRAAQKNTYNQITTDSNK